ncbi:hypothetical protein [Plantactinospora mayteni]|uniref:hypothetical protein n=1 Tax=Plantactinospora mayteni TaxID=566021 RepID=UPI0019403AD9|nr:hypothetical protein [Plantactinospora mayteni]
MALLLAALAGAPAAANTAATASDFYVTYGASYIRGTITWYNRSADVDGVVHAVSECRRASFTAMSDYELTDAGVSPEACPGTDTSFSIRLSIDVIGGIDAIWAKVDYRQEGTWHTAIKRDRCGRDGCVTYSDPPALTVAAVRFVIKNGLDHKCMTAVRSGDVDGIPYYWIDGRPCAGSSSQAWTFGGRWGLGLVNVASGQCLDFNDYYTPLRTKPCTYEAGPGMTQQQWTDNKVAYRLESYLERRWCVENQYVNGVYLGIHATTCNAYYRMQEWYQDAA